MILSPEVRTQTTYPGCQDDDAGRERVDSYGICVNRVQAPTSSQVTERDRGGPSPPSLSRVSLSQGLGGQFISEETVERARGPLGGRTGTIWSLIPHSTVYTMTQIRADHEDDPEELSRAIHSRLTLRGQERASTTVPKPGSGHSAPVLTHKDTIDALKAFVTAPSSQNEAESSVRLLVRSSALKSSFMEILFNKHMTVGAVKDKLQSHVGTSSSSMVLTLMDNRGGKVADLVDEGKKLGYYSPLSGYVLHVMDSDGMSLANTVRFGMWSVPSLQTRVVI